MRSSERRARWAERVRVRVRVRARARVRVLYASPAIGPLVTRWAHRLTTRQSARGGHVKHSRERGGVHARPTRAAVRLRASHAAASRSAAPRSSTREEWRGEATVGTAYRAPRTEHLALASRSRRGRRGGSSHEEGNRRLARGRDRLDDRLQLPSHDALRDGAVPGHRRRGTVQRDDAVSERSVLRGQRVRWRRSVQRDDAMSGRTVLRGQRVRPRSAVQRDDAVSYRTDLRGERVLRGQHVQRDDAVPERGVLPRWSVYAGRPVQRHDGVRERSVLRRRDVCARLLCDASLRRRRPVHGRWPMPRRRMRGHATDHRLRQPLQRVDALPHGALLRRERDVHGRLLAGSPLLGHADVLGRWPLRGRWRRRGRVRGSCTSLGLRRRLHTDAQVLRGDVLLQRALHRRL